MYDKEKLRDILINDEYKTVDDNGKIFPPSHDIYRMISETLINSGSHITPKHIYTILKNDRNGMYSAVLKTFGIDKKAAIQINHSKDSTFNATDLDNSSTSVSLQKFNIIISEEKWAQIKPTRQTYGRSNNRKYKSLQRGKWTHIFAEKIWHQTKLPCAFSFKRAKVYLNSDAKCYTRFKGTCNECGAQLIGLLYNKPIKGSDAVFECSLAGFSTEVVRKKKRQLKGFLREKIANTLIEGHKSASVWRNEEATRLMAFDDNIPPILFDATVLRKAKQEESDKRQQLSSTDPLQNLHIAKCTRFLRTIHNIGLNPFYCMYWSLEQQIMYKKAHKQDDNCFLTIDATGSIGKKLRLPNGEKSPHLFLYECVCVSELGNFPVFQMVSAKQDASLISYFLSEIVRDGAPIPRIVVTDFEKAILIAIARIFANCIDLRHYLQICYNIINNKDFNNVPQCYIRLDVSHFINIIAKWECLRGKAPKIRQFFLRCLGQAYQMENFTVVHNFLQSVLIVALSEEIGLDLSDTLLSSEIHLREVNNVIKGVAIDDIETDDYNYNDDEEIVAGGWTTLAESLFSNAQEIARNSRNGSTANAYYNPEAARKIKSLMTYLPLWTSIMRPHFKCGSLIASSSFVEAEFSEIKTRVFKNQLPMRIDKFIIKHLEYLEGRLRLTAGSEKILSKNISCPLNAPDALTISNEESIPIDTPDAPTTCNEELIGNETEKKEDIDIDKNKNEVARDSLNEIENWRSKIKRKTPVMNDDEQVAKRKKSNYLTPCADWDLITTNKAVGISLLKNGSVCNATTVGKEKIVIRETCAFDSIFQVVANGICMSDAYKTAMITSSNLFLKLIMDVLTRGKITANDYSTRATILCDIAPFVKKACTRNLYSLNANCNAAHLAEILFADIPSSTTTYNCDNCGHNYRRTSPTCNINVDVIIQYGLDNMQQAISDNIIARKEATCNNCKEHVSRSISYGPHLIIDTSVLTDHNYIRNQDIHIKYTLDNISKFVTVDDNNYTLSGVVTYSKYGVVDITLRSRTSERTGINTTT